MNEVCAGDDLASLAAAAQAGNARSLETLLFQVRPQVFRYVLARLGDRTLAEDVTQEVTMTIVSALPRYVDTGRSPIAWVFGIAQNKISETQRTLRRRHENVVQDVPERRSTDQATDPEASLLRTETARHLDALLATLPEVQADIMRLRVAGGLSADEVAAVLGMSAGAVRVAQHRAMAKLRALVAAGVTS